MKNVNLIMRDYAHQDTRSTHAMLFGYGDRREDHGMFGGDDLDKALTTSEEMRNVYDRAKRHLGLVEGQDEATPEMVQRVSFHLLIGSLFAAILSRLF